MKTRSLIQDIYCVIVINDNYDILFGGSCACHNDLQHIICNKVYN